MARNANKGKSRPATSAPAASASSSSKLPSTIVPPPYRRLPASLSTFTSKLSPAHIYITHLDTHPASLKRQIFLVPIFMNLAVIGLLCWRAYYIAPYYWALILTIWGQQTPYRVDVENTGWDALGSEVVRRALTMLCDATLLKFLAPWPLDFFVGRSSPTAWRLKCGFKPVEVAVRRSRPSWDGDKLPKGWLRDPEGVVAKERILPAVDRAWIWKKTAYLMMDKDWDLDFGGMIAANQLVKEHERSSGKKGNSMEDFKKQVLVHSPQHGGWLVWEVWRIDDDLASTPASAASASAEGSGSADNRAMIHRFRDKLAAQGKEDLFYRWVEVVQFETEKPGGFTPERQEKAKEEVVKLFAQHGVDFDQFWKDIEEEREAGEEMPKLQEDS